MLAINAVVLLAAVVLALRRPSGDARKHDIAWVRAYADKLEVELMDRRRIERDLAFMASFAERDPNCIIEMNLDGKIGYCNPAADHTFPDLVERGRNHPALAGFIDVIPILQRDRNSLSAGRFVSANAFSSSN